MEYDPGQSEKRFDVDTVCLAVGLNPMTERWYGWWDVNLILSVLGGHVPLHDENMETTVPGVYVAGDVTGVEEASSAMEGRQHGRCWLLQRRWVIKP